MEDEQMNQPDFIDPNSVTSNINAKIRNDTIREILKASFKDPKTRILDDSLNLVNEVIRCLIIEATMRGAKQTMRDHKTVIELEQVEKILPQLMLDFP